MTSACGRLPGGGVAVCLLAILAGTAGAQNGDATAPDSDAAMAARQKHIKALMEIVAKADPKAKNDDRRKVIKAMRTLGKMNALEAVPLLIEKWDVRATNEEMMFWHEIPPIDARYPALKVLWQMGSIVLPHLCDAIAAGDTELGEAASRTILSHVTGSLEDATAYVEARIKLYREGPARLAAIYDLPTTQPATAPATQPATRPGVQGPTTMPVLGIGDLLSPDGEVRSQALEDTGSARTAVEVEVMKALKAAVSKHLGDDHYISPMACAIYAARLWRVSKAEALLCRHVDYSVDLSTFPVGILITGEARYPAIGALVELRIAPKDVLEAIREATNDAQVRLLCWVLVKRTGDAKAAIAMLKASEVQSAGTEKKNLETARKLIETDPDHLLPR